ncbi:MAG: T9SS type A sorting domain-containing protein [Salinivirgaceae bacterium]
MRKLIVMSLILLAAYFSYCQDNFENIELHAEITSVQPMTGIVFWSNSSNNNTDAISLEFSYMLFSEVVKDSGVYVWDKVEEKLNDIASRNHQAIFRFRYVYPGYKTSVPAYILNRNDYNETVGLSEGRTTYFPDWENEELMRFTLEFYKEFSARYDNDPRLAFIQVGFGLWGEYHIYDGPFVLGKTFPSKAFQEQFFYNLDSCFENIPWSISIDAADDTYSPFESHPELKDLKFGLFDDSFMHSSHSGYNTTCWNFFDRNRYQSSPGGGEFSYYSNYDQAHVLDYPDGPYGKPFETFARDFHISYMIGNDQPNYQSMERIKEASMASGYRFKIVSLKTTTDSSVFEILNFGVAPIYYDAYIAVNGVKSSESLKYLAPGQTKVFSVPAGAKNAEITIESEKLVPGQKIEFYGTQELPTTSIKKKEINSGFNIYPNPVNAGTIYIELDNFNENEDISLYVYNVMGQQIEHKTIRQVDVNSKVSLSTRKWESGVYFIKTQGKRMQQTTKIIIEQI